MTRTDFIRRICDAIDADGFVSCEASEKIIDDSQTGAPKAMAREISAIEDMIVGRCF